MVAKCWAVVSAYKATAPASTASVLRLPPSAPNVGAFDGAAVVGAAVSTE